MNVRYQREMKRNFLIVEPEALARQEYVCRMMCANAIEGLLRFSLRQVDDVISYYYEITSRQPLSRMLENRTVQREELRTLVLEISGLLNQLERYLLPENAVWLEPEALYLEPESFRLRVCLIPGRDVDFSKSLEKLLEYLLGKVDHRDKDSVVMAYGLYQETRKEGYGIQDLLKLLYRTGEEEKEEVMPHVFSGREQPAKQTNPVLSHLPLPTRPKKEGFWTRVSEKLKVFGEGQTPLKQEDTLEVPWNQIFQEESLDESLGEPLLVRETPDIDQNTALLCDVSRKKEMRALLSLEEGAETIPISYYPFIIGKQENLVDYVLKREEVSRLHLRIDREDKNYRITDLNSTNGTAVGGKLLENNGSALVFPGDEVQIAGYRYKFT